MDVCGGWLFCSGFCVCVCVVGFFVCGCGRCEGLFDCLWGFCWFGFFWFFYLSCATKQREMSAQRSAVLSSLGMFQISFIFGIMKLLETSGALSPPLSPSACFCWMAWDSTLFGWSHVGEKATGVVVQQGTWAVTEQQNIFLFQTKSTEEGREKWKLPSGYVWCLCPSLFCPGTFIIFCFILLFLQGTKWCHLGV